MDHDWTFERVIPLDWTTRLVFFQFSFSNPKLVPASVRRLEQETREQSKERAARKTNKDNGVREIIPPTTNVTLFTTFDFDDMGAQGYELVDAFYQPRVRSDGTVYHAVRYTFCRQSFVNDLNGEFLQARPWILAELQELCLALWRVRASLCPFFENDTPIHGQSVVSVNMELRVPMFGPDGRQLTGWKTDPSGRKIGNAPALIWPEHELVVRDWTLSLVPYEPPTTYLK